MKSAWNSCLCVKLWANFKALFLFFNTVASIIIFIILFFAFSISGVLENWNVYKLTKKSKKTVKNL